MKTIKQDVNPLNRKKRIAGHDIVLNVNYKDAMIRFGIILLLPILTLVIDKHLIIYTAPVMAYLFLSAITHFCVVKYVWHRYIKHEPAPALPAYGDDPDYPEESI
jgi:hypothetical protein